MTGRAVAYLRKSSGADPRGTEANQREAIARASAGRGDIIAPADYFADWHKSGADRERPSFLMMVAELEAGRVSAIYVDDTSRVARRVATFTSLLDEAEDAGVPVYDHRGYDLTHPDNRTAAEYQSVSDASQHRDITRKNRANRDRKVARGDDLGEAPYGWQKVKLSEPGVNAKGRPAEAGACVNVCTDPDAILTVLNAYTAAGSALGAAHLLNAIGHPTKRGRAWNNRAVQDVVTREAPELLPARLGRRNARHYRVRVLSGLLRCYCGTVMSPNGSGWMCARGHAGAHERPYNVTESRILPWIIEEADRLRVPHDIVESDGPQYDDSEDRRRLDAARDLIGEDAYLAALDRLRAAQDAHSDRLALRQTIPPAIDWEAWQRDPDREPWSTEQVNAALRAMWEGGVQLGPDLLPVSAGWTMPEWRS